MLYFLKEDIIKLDEMIKKTKEDLEDALKSIGQSVEGESNTWHDNSAFDEAQRLSSLYSQRLRDLLNIRREVMVEDYPKQIKNVDMGHLVVVKDKDGQIMTFFIGSYMTFQDEHDEINIVSYAAPIGKALIGSTIGQRVEFNVGNRKISFEVLGIKLPQKGVP